MTVTKKRGAFYAALFLVLVVSLNLELYLRGADFFVFLFVDYALIGGAHLALFLLSKRSRKP